MNQLPASPTSDYLPMGPAEEPPHPSMWQKVRRYLGFLKKFWWIPLITLFLGICGEAAYVYWKQPVFISHASMWETVKLTVPGTGLFSEDVQNFLGTQSELLQSTTLRDQALTLMRAMTNSVEVPRGKDGQPLPVAIRVSGSAKSSVFVIQASSANPAFTQNYLNALMQAYLGYKRNVRKVISGDTLASISEQVQKWERDLKTEQEILNSFERTNNLVILQEEGTVLGGYLAKLKTQLSDLQLEEHLLSGSNNPPVEIAAGTNSLAPAMTLADSNNAPPLSSASSDQQSSFRELQLLKMQREHLSQSLRPKHPKIAKLDEQIQRAEKVLEIYSQQSRDQIRAARDSNHLKIQNVQNSIHEWEAKVVEANARIAEAERLKLNVQRVQSVYDRLRSLVENVGISRNIDQESLAILESASPAFRSYASEKSGLNTAIFLGLSAGLGIIFLIGYWDDRFTSVVEVNSALGDSVVGMLPDVGSGDSDKVPLLELNDSRHVYAESYRSLRSALFFLPTEGERPKVILVTSAMPNEGKSTVTSNLARTLAQSGSRVLLVDGDLRKGHLHHFFGLQAQPGFSDLLARKAEPSGVIQTDTLPALRFVSRGSISGNPGDLLLGPNIDEILARWRREFEYVLIDSSPVFAADDACCLAPKVDGTLFVVRNRHSGARIAREALEVLAKRQARVLGVIFNGTDVSARSYHYYKYADYHTPAASA